MGTTPIPTNGGLLIGLATKMHTGIVDLGADIPITMLTAAELQSSLAAFIPQDAGFNTARSTRLAASQAFQGTIGTVQTWLLDTRKVLAVRLGDQWSTAWAQAGFINHSTAIPTKAQDRLGLMLSLAGFLTANPSYEAPTLDVTAAKATAVRATALAAENVLTNANLDLKTADQTWTAAYEALVGLIRTLIRNLQGKLAGNDPRWLAFGLQMPATNSTPGRPENLVVQLDQNGSLLVTCDAVALATRYRCRARILGMEEEYRLIVSSKEPMMSLSKVPAGQTIEIVIQAVNGNLQGVASMPALYSAMPAVSKPAETAVPLNRLSTGGNGNGNSSHGNGVNNEMEYRRVI